MAVFPTRSSRALLALVVGAVGFLTVTTVSSPPGPRLSRKARLVDLIRTQDERARDLRAQVDDLQAEIAGLLGGAAGRGRDLDELRSRLNRLAPQAGLSPVTGPGLEVELADSDLRSSPSGDLNDLVIHEQDLQAVVNALWGAGAEAISVNGERITGTSAIRCVGNTLLLHGSVYAPPYRIAAIGEPGAMEERFLGDSGVESFAVAAEAFGLRFAIRRAGALSLPAFRGVTATRYAEAA